MIGCLRGTVVEVTEDTVLIDVRGIGFEVEVHDRGLRSLPGRNQPITIYTRLQISDKELTLYGFLAPEEMELFKILTSVSGIGPKVAMAVLGRFEPDEFYRAIAVQDQKLLTTVPGVGKKIAGRLMFELKDRIPTTPITVGQAMPPEADDLLEALLALGYSKEEVYPQIMNLVRDGKMGTLEENFRQILKTKGR